LLQKKRLAEPSGTDYISPVSAYEQRSYTPQLLLRNVKNARVSDTWTATAKEPPFASYVPETTLQSSTSITLVRQKAPVALTWNPSVPTANKLIRQTPDPARFYLHSNTGLLLHYYD
jgi:flavin reductase (DIM6/NTAB) family NADH-FMN oxidoreductase RutF